MLLAYVVVFTVVAIVVLWAGFCLRFWCYGLYDLGCWFRVCGCYVLDLLWVCSGVVLLRWVLLCCLYFVVACGA